MASPGTRTVTQTDSPYQKGPSRITVSLLSRLAELDPTSQEAIDIIRSLPSMASQTAIEDQDARAIIDRLDHVRFDLCVHSKTTNIAYQKVFGCYQTPS